VHAKVNLLILPYCSLIEKFLIGKFLGQRFIKSKDVGLILIYDSQGIIAGAQMAVSYLNFHLIHLRKNFV
jgi:hypothetical protein